MDQRAQWRSVSPQKPNEEGNRLAISSNQRTYDFQMVGVESDRDSAAHAFGAFHSRVRARTKPKAAARTAYRKRPSHVGMHHEREPAAEVRGVPIGACTRLQPRGRKACVSVNQCQSMSIDGNRWQLMTINVNRWQLMTINVNRWQLISIDGNQWPSPAAIGT